MGDMMPESHGEECSILNIQDNSREKVLTLTSGSGTNYLFETLQSPG